MEADGYKLALSQARQELESTNRELKTISLRASQLEAVVAQLEALIASSRPIALSLFLHPHVGPELDDPLPDLKGPETPLWRAAISGLNGKKGDFTVSDAIAALERTGRFINSPNKKAIVRNALKQRPDKFQKLETPGHYCVIGFEAGEEEVEH
jgi:hypothetical protein